METQTHRFTLDDADGTPHTYEMTALMPSDGMPVCLQLYGMLAGPLGRLVSSVLEGDIADMLDDVGGLSNIQAVMDNEEIGGQLFGALKGIEWDAIGADLSRILGSPQAVAICRTLLNGTTRDGQELDNEAVYDLAYQRNYVEHHKAMWEALKYNRFFPQWSSFADENETPSAKGRETSQPGSRGRAAVN